MARTIEHAAERRKPGRADNLAAGRALAAAALAVLVGTASPVLARDPLRQPFATDSIWNMPIGSQARYVDPRLPFDLMGRNTKLTKLDEEIIVLRPDAPLTPIHKNEAGWTGRNRCEPQGPELGQIPLPDDFVVPDNRENGSAAILLPDRRTVVQVQPLTRCRAGGPATALVAFSPLDLYGPGMTGAHGGSNLSALGGSLRVGELRPGGPAPAHALKLLVDARLALYPCKAAQHCFRWPASTADDYAVGRYGKDNPGAVAAMRMGALLAIPQDADLAALGLETEPGRLLASTLQGYGAYVVDDSFGDGFGFTAETGPDGRFATQFRKDHGFDFVTRLGDATPWSRDAARLLKALRVVDNNAAVSVGGGGKPIRPLAEELVPPAAVKRP
ncbi:hypothetical protein [uncultured Alsobacter sp.]|uniref:hypothetical protein n=1 Tax=uncultured Alsobacter sp. TaxID=1748258 RepID=UPI0025DD2547|nr:hypothetical protein [uncultured Alsobacter sp.]